jgi:outer membrane lipoprotein-sorting protein
MIQIKTSTYRCLAGVLCSLWCGVGTSAAQDPEALVQAAFDYWRGVASVATVEMTVHRPDWQRTMLIKAWTRGQTESLFRTLAPRKDKDNATLKNGREMWIYNPRVNRVIKLPPSMMSQSWMGSDFSNNDLAKSDSLITDYTHTITGTEKTGEHTVYVVDAIPKPHAPVVWGLQRLIIREDFIFLREEFFDEDLQPVKILTAHDIQPLGGKLFPKTWRMQKVGTEDEFTQLVYRELEFVESLPDKLFSLDNLKNPRRF